MFRAGQKVVCIHDYTEERKRFNMLFELPVKGKVYTVRATRHFNGEYLDPNGLLLEEIRNANVTQDGKLIEPHFSACFFRPVVSTGEIKRVMETYFNHSLRPSQKVVQCLKYFDETAEVHARLTPTMKARKEAS